MPAAASIMMRARCNTSARAMFSRKGVDTAANNSTTIAATASSTRLILRFMELSPLLQVTPLAAVALRAAAIDSRLGGNVAPTHNLDECDQACPENFERSLTPSLVNCTRVHRLPRTRPLGLQVSRWDRSRRRVPTDAWAIQCSWQRACVVCGYLAHKPSFAANGRLCMDTRQR